MSDLNLKMRRLETREVMGYHAISSRDLSQLRCGGFDIQFVNMSDRLLKVKNRMGIVRTMLPDPLIPEAFFSTMQQQNRAGVGIYISATISLQDLDATMESLREGADKSALSSELLRSVQAAYHRCAKEGYTWQQRQHQYTEINASFIIDIDDLSNGYSYFSELDLTMGLFHINQEVPTPVHPNTQELILGSAGEGTDYLHSGSHNSDGSALKLSLQVVDNSGHSTLADKYINLAGSTYKIPIVRDPRSLKTGLRITRNYTPVNSIGKSDQEWVGLEDAFDLGLANTAEEARTKADVQGRYESNLLKMRQDNEILKESNLRLKQEQESEMAQYKYEAQRAKDRADAMTARLALETQRLRADAARSDSFFKTVGTTFSLFAGCYMIWQWYRKSKEGGGGDLPSKLPLYSIPLI